jgi:hypothetical protein
METESNLVNPIISNENTKKRQKFSRTLPKASSMAQIAGPGFVVWLRCHKKAPKLFVTWAETSVIELSPYIKDAWQYPTRTSANDNVRRALGPRIKDYTVRIIGPLGPRPQCSAQTAARASDDDGGVVGYNTCEFRIKR